MWIDDELLSPYDYYQYWRNTDDKDVGRFLRLFTELPLGEVARLEALDGAELNEAKKRLALEATRMCHGDAAATAAAETARQTFEEGGTGAALPVLEVPRAELAVGVPAFKLFQRAGLSPSGSEARRLIQGGGARLNDATLSGELTPISLADVGPSGTIKLSAGRKRHALVRPV